MIHREKRWHLAGFLLQFVFGKRRTYIGDTEDLADFFDVVRRDPTLGDDALFGQIRTQHVHGVENSLNIDFRRCYEQLMFWADIR